VEPVLAFKGVSKRFFGVPAVQDVSFGLAKGRVLGLVGENGAGKSTLMNLLGGVLPLDEGQMVLEGRPYAPKSPRDATRAGVAFIHQELNLFTNLTVAENLFVDRYPRLLGLPFLDGRRMHREARAALRAIGLDMAPGTRVDDLSPGERQLVEIAKALTADARIIILDEPTTSLTDRETERLFRTLRDLRARGTSLIYISHILGDVLSLADEIVVLRDGKVVGGGPKGDFTASRMISLMVGRDIAQLYPPRQREGVGERLLEVRGVSQPGVLHEVSLTLHKGEVLGVYGLMGSGRTELARTLFGLEPYARGHILLDGVPVGRLTPRRAVDLGMAFVTEDRRAEGLLMNASVADNLSLVTVSSAASPFQPVHRGRVKESVREVSASLKIKAGDPFTQPVKTLSGGNQQKTVLGKWVASKPKLFLLDEPTRGVDVGAKYEVYTIVRKLAVDGAGVLFISSELEELMGVCDAILVMSYGEVVGRFERGEFDRERILAAAFREAVA